MNLRFAKILYITNFMEIKVKAKKWESSMGIILPKSIVDLKKIKENDRE